MSTSTSSSASARIREALREKGPCTSAALEEALGMPRRTVRNVLINLMARKEVETLGPVRPQWYAVTGDARLEARRKTMLRHRSPTPQDVRENTRRAAALVLPHITVKGQTEIALHRAVPELTLSHLRAALQWLASEGSVIRSESTEAGARAIYRLDVIDFPQAPRTPGPDHRRVERHLTQVSLTGSADTVHYMSLTLHLSREQVMEALAWLHAAGRLRWRRVGELPLFRLDTENGEVAA